MTQFTKEDACIAVIEKICNDMGISPTELKDEHVLTSSALGVAMEKLGLIKDVGMRGYIASRGGSLMTRTGQWDFDGEAMYRHVPGTEPKINILSVRGLLAVLPSAKDQRVTGQDLMSVCVGGMLVENEQGERATIVQIYEEGFLDLRVGNILMLSENPNNWFLV